MYFIHLKNDRQHFILRYKSYLNAYIVHTFIKSYTKKERKEKREKSSESRVAYKKTFEEQSLRKYVKDDIILEKTAR